MDQVKSRRSALNNRGRRLLRPLFLCNRSDPLPNPRPPGGREQENQRLVPQKLFCGTRDPNGYLIYLSASLILKNFAARSLRLLVGAQGDRGRIGGVWRGCQPQECGCQASRDGFMASPTSRHPIRESRARMRCELSPLTPAAVGQLQPRSPRHLDRNCPNSGSLAQAMSAAWAAARRAMGTRGPEQLT